MRILDISHIFPFPPHDGDRLPMVHFMRCLAPRAEYTMVTPRPANAEHWEQGCSVLREWGVAVRGVEPSPATGLAQALRCLRHGRPWINRFFDPNLLTAVDKALAEGGWDIVQAESIFSAQHLPVRIAPRSLLIARDCLSAGHHTQSWRKTRRLKDLAQIYKIGWMERSLFRRFDHILTISPSDRANIERLAGGVSVGVLPNGVDLTQFSPAPEREESDTVIFTGAMDYAPNVDAMKWFTGEIWPKVRAARPEARLWIAGKSPVMEIQTLADAKKGIAVTGWVERIEDWIARAAVVVSPLRFGAGMKNKVLEGAAMAKAMVVTPLSLQDIALKPGRDVLSAGEAGAFAAAVVELLGDTARRRELGAAARRVVEQRYTWEQHAEILWQTYRMLAGGK